MTVYRRSPRLVAAALAPLRDVWVPETLLGEVQAVWTDAVGALIAAEARPVSERGGVVTIACSAAVWAQELDLLSTTLLVRLNECLRDGGITRLRCIVSAAG
jgi:predicted nucleic acid-binding Zn ribbon protein